MKPGIIKYITTQKNIYINNIILIHQSGLVLELISWSITNITMENMCRTLGRVDRYQAFYRMLTIMDPNQLNTITNNHTKYDARKISKISTYIICIMYMASKPIT